MPERDEALRIGQALMAGGPDREAALAELSVLYRVQDSETAKEQILDTVRRAAKMDKRAFQAVRKDLEKLIQPKKPRSSPGERPLPVIKKLIKYDARPASWEIHLQTRGHEYVSKCPTPVLTSTKKFSDLFWEEHNLFPFPDEFKISQWRRMLEEAPKETRAETSPEATPLGYLKQMIEDFEEKAKPEKLAEMALRATPVKLDSGEIVLRLPVLMRHLKTEGIEGRTRSEVLFALRESGYKDELKRIGKGPVRVWVKYEVGQNGKLPI